MVAVRNRNLHRARDVKNDEFYTQLTDIEKELNHYLGWFEGKTVYCNCDDPWISNFFHYFSYNYEKLGLRGLFASCYRSRDPNLFSRKDSDQAVWTEYHGNRRGGLLPSAEDMVVHELVGDGDFRSEECISLLRTADIVCTNPPFSLFREYVAQLMEHEKKFLIIGNFNAVKYNEIFPLLQTNKVWLGVSKGSMDFDLLGGGQRSMGNTTWFTNLPHYKRNEELVLYKKYNPDEYPRFENYDAINVDKVAEIPKDYKGLMGVPITFLDKYHPSQFEIVGLGRTALGKKIGVGNVKEDHRARNAGLRDGSLYWIENGEVKIPFVRIIIRRKP